MDGSIALVECSKRGRRVWSEPFDDARVEVGRKIRAPRRFFALFARQALAQTTRFTNHDYLFSLLLLLTAVSGAGGAWSVDAACRRAAPRAFPGAAASPARRRAAVVALRAQLAVVYVFASLWKTHPDWVSGAMVRGIFLGFEEQGVHRGVPWAAMEAKLGPRLFAAVAFGGLLLDGSMAAALLCLRPSRESFAAFAALSCAFHGFTCFTMSQRIGYAFPGACVCAVVLFAPVGGPGGDAPLHAWLARAAAGVSAGEPRAAAAARPTRPLRCLLLLYVLLQVLVPLRMPLFHGRDFAMSARGYRFSWTMMLHGKDQGARGAMSFLKFAYLAPTVGGRALPRRAYLGPALFPGGPGDDERTLPLEQMQIVGTRRALMGVYPRSWLKVGAGIGRAIQHAVPEGHAVAVAGRVEFDRWFGGSPPNFRTLDLGQIEVDSADSWTNRLLSSSSRSTAESLASKRSHTRTLKSG